MKKGRSRKMTEDLFYTIGHPATATCSRLPLICRPSGGKLVHFLDSHWFFDFARMSPNEIFNRACRTRRSDPKLTVRHLVNVDPFTRFDTKML